jgi:hypothetical protein
LHRGEHRGRAASERLATNAPDEREERGARDVERIGRPRTGVEDRARDERVDDLGEREAVQRERVHGRAAVVERAGAGRADELLQ